MSYQDLTLFHPDIAFRATIVHDSAWMEKELQRKIPSTLDDLVKPRVGIQEVIEVKHLPTGLAEVSLTAESHMTHSVRGSICLAKLINALEEQTKWLKEIDEWEL